MEELLSLRPLTDGELARWYETELAEAFAPQERKPLADIRALRDRGRYDVLGLFGGGPLLGYAALWSAPGGRVLLLDYLGVTAARRNGGLGGQLLSLLGGFCGGRRLVAEAELPIPGGGEDENALRRRRIGFYERCGFAPVYEMATCGLRWQALVLGDPPPPGSPELAALMAGHRAVYGSRRADVRIPLPAGERPAPPYWMEQA